MIRNGWTAREKNGAVELLVYVQPRAKATEIAGRYGGLLKLRIAAPPVDNAANEAVVSFFASYFSLAKSRVKIVAGERSREKTVRIEGIALSEASRLFE